ncbi:MAG: glycoside hydrolase family 13 protein [Bacteroidota bacterium]
MKSGRLIGRSAFLLVLTIPLSGALWGAGKDKAAHGVPGWAKRAVWYQIFPERFRNGDASNDPRPEDMAGSWPHQVDKDWQTSNWTGDWYELQPWERSDSKGFYFHAQQRRYGGDLQGVLDKLDYLKDLGITAIYFNPLFESPSLHKYDATCYHHIDNNFGPDPAGDKRIWSGEDPANPSTWKWSSADRLFLKLIQEAHKRGMKIVIDGVFNHVGMTFWAFQDVEKNQQASPFKDWFIINQWDNPATSQNEFKYAGWYGVKELPEFREDDRGLVHGPREHIHAVVQRWMDPNGDGNPEDGIDGWRLDAADKVNIEFWKEFRTWVWNINPEAYIVGELWWEDWGSDKMFNAAPWLQGDTFDAVMNYRWAREAFLYFAGVKTKIRATDFSARLDALRQDYPTDVNFGLMNLYDSHDTDRIPSHIINGDLSYDKRVGAADNREYLVRKPNEDELATEKLMALFQMTYVGAPVIYYGTEAGMWGGDDPDDRKPMLWADYTYEPEKSHPFNKPRPVDANVFSSALFEYYKNLIGIRNSNSALSDGEFVPLVTDDEHDVYCYLRHDERQSVIVAMNPSTVMNEVQCGLPESVKAGSWKSLLDQRAVQAQSHTLRLTLKPKSGDIFIALP